MENIELQHKVKTSVCNALRHLYDIHRPLIVGRGIGSDAIAETYGNLDVATDAVKKAQKAALEAWNDQNCTHEFAEEVARKAALGIFDEARSKNLIFLRDGTRSATIVRSYLIAMDL